MNFFRIASKRFVANLFAVQLIIDVVLLITLATASDNTTVNIKNYLKCCHSGDEQAKKYQNCNRKSIEDDNGIDSSLIWRSLCTSMFDLCCSNEMDKEHCKSGELAAKKELQCDGGEEGVDGDVRDVGDGDGKRITKKYIDCCRSCEIGLAVAASKEQCNDPIFGSLIHDESYKRCCGEDLANSSTTNAASDDGDGTVIMLNDDDDICDKVEKLCEHICENTKDSYICKCRDGFKLDDNKVTCSPLNAAAPANNQDVKMGSEDEGDGDGDGDEDEDDDGGGGGYSDDLEHDENDQFNKRQHSCQPGYKWDKKRSRCIDIDECLLSETERLTLNCKSDQYCHNTIGSYRCLNIKSTDCPNGYRFNNKMEMCEDINECLDGIDECSKLDQQCLNKKGSYICIFKHQSIVDKGKCETGYVYNSVDDKCEDYNECDDLPCDEGYICINYPGRYDCYKQLINPNRKQIDIIPNGFGYSSSPPSPPSSADGRSSMKLTSSSSIDNKCSSGFRQKHGRCVDIDECVMDKNSCDSNQICTNDIGGYHCDCKIGFNMDSTLNVCVDINECSINNHNCLPTQRCDNTVGSYICIRMQSCGTGYTLNAETGNCDDDDECAAKTDTCTPEYECRNTKGSFRCDRRRPTTTTTTATSTTTARTTTTTTKSSSSSSSSSLLTNLTTTTTTAPATAYSNRYGFSSRYNGDGGGGGGGGGGTALGGPTYVASRTNSEQYHSNNYYPRYIHGNERNGGEPACGLGFHRNHLGACVDMNECQMNSPCGTHQKCINTNGSYRCQNRLQCGAGYKSTPDGTSCIDIDECETGEHSCAENQFCRNRNGGYICSCPPGHTLAKQNGDDNNDEHHRLTRCIDINECEHDRPQVCPSNANCLNTIGSYYCECKSGFKKQNGNDKLCNDVDECQEIPGLCQQKCVNFWGGYRCTCNAGYELNSDNRTCNDVDECEVHKSYKLCMGFCINVPGSYECSCPRGYELAMDKNTCRDIDECATGEFCTGTNDICTNIRGSYKCTTIRCPYGYVYEKEKKNRCRLINEPCENDDCYNKPVLYTYNFITLVSNLVIPPKGLTIFSLRGPAFYDNIDFDLKIVKIQAAANIEKASENHFRTFKHQHQVELSLMRTLEGPQDIELELSTTVFMNGQPLGKSVAKVFIIVSQYSF